MTKSEMGKGLSFDISVAYKEDGRIAEIKSASPIYLPAVKGKIDGPQRLHYRMNNEASRLEFEMMLVAEILGVNPYIRKNYLSIAVTRYINLGISVCQEL